MINPYISLSWHDKNPYPTASAIKMKEKASFTTNANFTSFACTSLVMFIFIGLQAKMLQDLDENKFIYRFAAALTALRKPSGTSWRGLLGRKPTLGFFHHAAEIELMSEEWSKFKQHPLISLGMGVSNSLLKFTLKVKDDDFLFFGSEPQEPRQREGALSDPWRAGREKLGGIHWQRHPVAPVIEGIENGFLTRLKYINLVSLHAFHLEVLLGFNAIHCADLDAWCFRPLFQLKDVPCVSRTAA